MASNTQQQSNMPALANCQLNNSYTLKMVNKNTDDAKHEQSIG